METNALDLLGRLLASENISIIRKKCATASFGITDRVLTLPLWSNITPVQETLLIAHETGHALFTTAAYATAAIDKTRPKFHHHLNICEDARIERLMKEKFPGLRRDFYLGYNEFHAADFFKLGARDLSGLNLIDRINMHFKLGHRISLKFNARENQFLNDLTDVVTEEDVVRIAQEIYDYSKARAEEKKKEEEKEEADDNSSSDKNDEEADENLEFEESEEETDGVDTDEESEEETKGKTLDEELESETQNNFDSSLKNTISTDLSKVYNIKTKLCHPVKLIPVEQILKDFYTLDKRRSARYLNFRAANAKLVAHMVQTFEMKRAALAMKRTDVSESGVLNMAKIHKYKVATELFKQYKIEANETSHGFIMLLDFSGSMTDNFKNVMEQVITLVQFCTAVDIKFEVLAFTDQEIWYSSAERYLNHEAKRTIIDNGKDNELFIYSSRNSAILQFYKNGMKRLDMELISNVLYDNLAVLVTQKDPVIKLKYTLNGTPLIDALLFVNDYLTKFKNKHNVQKTTLIILSDGGDTNTTIKQNMNSYVAFYRSKIFLNSTVTNRFYPITLTSYDQDNRDILQQKLTRIINDDHPEVKIVGFFVAQNSSRAISKSLENYKPKEQHMFEFRSECNLISNQLKKEGHATYKVEGYDQFFVIPNGETDNSSIFSNVSSTMTAAVIARSASGNNKKAKAGRFIANTFISTIA